MPTGYYSYPTYSKGEPGRLTSAVTEPGTHGGVFAKEPDRQTATRHGQSAGGRARMEDYDGQEEQSARSRSPSSRRGPQARRSGMRSQDRRTSAGGARTQRKSRRGFAAMSSEQQREIARKGGLTVSRNRRHMAEIGRVGGEHSHGGRRGRARR